MADHSGNTGDPRVFLAAQRTHLAWIRTGLALMGFGFVVARFGLFMRELAANDPTPPPSRGHFSLYAGTTLVLLGVAVLVLSTIEHARFIADFRRNAPLVPPRVSLGTVLALLLAVLGAAMAVYLVVVR